MKVLHFNLEQAEIVSQPVNRLFNNNRDSIKYLDQRLSLQLSPRKTEIVHVNDGFDFLGFHAERRKSGSGGKRTQITIPKEAIEDLKEKVQAATSYSHNEEAIRAKILALNAMIRGWGNYYRHCWKAASRFDDLDYFMW